MKTSEDILGWIAERKRKTERQLQEMDQRNLLHKLDHEAYYRALEDIEEFVKEDSDVVI